MKKIKEPVSFAVSQGWVMTHNIDGSMILVNTDNGKVLTIPADSVERMFKIANSNLA